MKPADAKRLQIEIYRRMTPAQRLDCCLRWTNLTYEFARGAIRADHADWTPAEVDRELGRRITGIDVTKLDWGRVRRQQAHLRVASRSADRQS
jgi:hypothetical protein